MKKTIGTVAIIFCLSSLCYSQFTKGKILAGGSFSANSNTSKYNDGLSTSKSNSVSFNPQIGYFFANNFTAGVGLDLGHTTFTLADNSKFTSNSISFEPFTRYYFDKFYGQASFHVGSTKSKSDAANSSTANVTNTGWSLAVGYAYLLNEHVAIEPLIGYKFNYLGSAVDGTYGSLFLKIGIQVYLGK
jgi:hypothetical protein